jgi:hypothetical protein
MNENHPYYRHADGIFQIDRYRAEASAMRRQGIHDSTRLTSFAKLLAVVGILLGMVAVAPVKQSEGDTFALRSSSSQTASHGAPARPPVF